MLHDSTVVNAPLGRRRHRPVRQEHGLPRREPREAGGRHRAVGLSDVLAQREEHVVLADQRRRSRDGSSAMPASTAASFAWL